MDFQRAIYKTSRSSADIDKHIFGAWEMDEITTRRAIADFKANHKIGDEITVDEFTAWLNSLGYYNLGTRHLIPTNCYRYV